MSKLKSFRKSRGLSQSQLTKVSGVNVRMIQGYEQGIKDINKAQAMTVYKLSEALKCRVVDLLEFEEDDNEK